MTIISSFVVMVFLYSLVSSRLERTIITGPIVFTSAGILLMLTLAGPREFEADRKAFLTIAEVGLVLTLFTDASRISLKALKSDERLPVRLLGIGMLPTILIGAIAALVIFPQLSIWEAGIIGAILAPTDAGLGEVVVNSPKVPVRIRQALSVEAGLNDGLAVPLLMFFIALAEVGTEGGGRVLMRFVVEQLGLGALVGILVGLAGGWLLGLARRSHWMAESLQQLGLVALPLLCVLWSERVGGSMFIAGYVAGLAVQIGFSEAAEKSVEFTEGWGRLLNFFVFFLFGLLTARGLKEFSMPLLIYAVMSLTAARMLPVAVALVGSRLSAATVVFMGWFGPRGLASIVLGLVYMEHELTLPGEPTIKLAVTATVLLSIFAHGLTAAPGIDLYARKIAALNASAPEHAQVIDAGR